MSIEAFKAALHERGVCDDVIDAAAAAQKQSRVVCESAATVSGEPSRKVQKSHIRELSELISSAADCMNDAKTLCVASASIFHDGESTLNSMIAHVATTPSIKWGSS